MYYDIMMYLYSSLTTITKRRNMTSRFTSNFEADASDLLENIEEIRSTTWTVINDILVRRCIT